MVGTQTEQTTKDEKETQTKKERKRVIQSTFSVLKDICHAND